MQHLSTCSCSRRSFLRGAGLTLSGFGVASLFPTPFIEQVMAGGLNSDRRFLFIFLRGGNDGTNSVIIDGLRVAEVAVEIGRSTAVDWNDRRVGDSLS